MDSPMLKFALDYVSRGWWVFPCREKPSEPFVRDGKTTSLSEKTPYTSKGLDDASIDVDQIKAWWSKWPNAMIGVNAGKSNLFVVDIDKKHVDGFDTYSTWNINDSAGLRSMTPSGGMHVVFTGSGKSSSNAKTGIDTRGVGGYFIAPPSKIIKGDYPGEYASFDDWGRTPGVIPDGLMSNLFPDKTTEYVRGNNSTPLDGEKRQLSRASFKFLAVGAPAGERNSTLFKVLADFAGCGYTKENTRDTVINKALEIGLSEIEFEQVLAHAFSKPRSASIPDSIQEKLATSGKNVASKITQEEQLVIELVLLASLLVDNALIPAIDDILTFDDFQGVKNKIIYRAISTVNKAGRKVDFLTVSDEVMKTSDKVKLDEVSSIVNQYSINSDNVLTYAYIIKEKSSIRKLESIMDNKAHYLKSGNLVEIISSIEGDITEIALEGGAKSTNVLDAGQAIDMVAEHTRKILAGEIQLLRTGFVSYDTTVGGIFQDELVICAGRPGDGKSSLSLSIANHVALIDNKNVLFFSLEMSTLECVCRLITQLTGIPYLNVYQGRMSKSQWSLYQDAADRISKSGLKFDDSTALTVPEMRSKVRKFTDKGLDLIVVDQLENVRGYDSLNESIRLNKIAYELRDTAKDFGVPVLLNHQLNRSSTDRKLKDPEPQLSDLNQAGEKPANQVWFIAHRKDEKGKILQSKIKMMKNRNGIKIDVPVMFVGERMLFSNVAHDSDRQSFADDFQNGNHFDDSSDSDAPWGG